MIQDIPETVSGYTHIKSLQSQYEDSKKFYQESNYCFFFLSLNHILKIALDKYI